ncbi:Na+/H+ antiporter NhaA [Nocardioides aquiterrae]|uniref:Na(+)/H(+) antiporter NhaA n=1 Tax=Nocardioides aquiterrae TaxID=203799 RepID=A0ABN1UBH5_9ACTN
MPHPSRRLFTRGTRLEDTRIAEALRAETTGGLLLIVAATVALVWSNTPWASAYDDLRDLSVGPLTLGTWAADGLLAVFFFVAGLELKSEFVTGDLRDPRRAALPVVAAVGGMVVPAAIYVLWNAGGALAGWAIPTATDIAFAVAVLAVISTHLPTGLRTFLLTLAVVDDLLAITIIAIFYTDALHPVWLLAAVLPVATFRWLVRRGYGAWALLPPAALAWVFVHESGIHATVAGVVLGFMVPVARAGRIGHVVRPISAGFAVPVFAFFAAGVTVGGWDGLVSALSDPVALGVLTGLVVGKTVGVAGSTWLLATFTRADLDDELSWVDVIGLSMLAGIGFTVSLLIGELAFGTGTVEDDHVKVGVLVGSLAAALVATVVLRARNRVYRRLCVEEQRDRDADGVPDVYQRDDGE